MLDLKFIRENPEKVKQGLHNKNAKVDIDALLRLDVEHRELLRNFEELRAEQNKKSKETRGESAELKELKVKIQELEKRANEKKQELDTLLMVVPNIPFDDVPIGKDESENVVVREVGDKPTFTFPIKDYLTLGERFDIIDIESASRISGSRFGYLKGAAAWLEFALVHYTLRTLTDETVLVGIIQNNSHLTGLSSKPFIPVVPPVMIKPEIFRKMARLDPGQEEERYYIPKDDLYLVGSAEHTLGPIHMDEVLPEAELPKRYIGFSTAFRREAGSYGKDTKGILRVHQFDKLEMESFCLPELSRKEHEFIVACQEYLVKGLGVPYRVVEICTGDMGGPDARQIDLESWMPGEGKYRETHTADLMTDYQARRLQTKVKRQESGKNELVHMIDATAFAIGRTLIAIIENYQTKEGGFKIPQALWPYVPFKEVMPNTITR